jgi:lipopolysaccharide export system protein LptC
LIRTDFLELDPEAYVARTESFVAVERDRDTLHARGMRVYLKQDRLQFNAEVRGRFLP